MYVSLKGTKEDFGHNVWAFTDNDLDKITREYLQLDAATADTKDIPLLFISFPFIKDPEWKNRQPNKTTCTVISLASYVWFKRWGKGRVNYEARGIVRRDHKTASVSAFWRGLVSFSSIRDHVDFFDVGSPLSKRYYIAAPTGEIYGIDHRVDRFSPRAVVKLRPDTSIPGLYLNGQDILSCGFAGAMFSGVITGSAVLKRNPFSDMSHLQKELKKKKPGTSEAVEIEAVQNGSLKPDD